MKATFKKLTAELGEPSKTVKTSVIQNEIQEAISTPLRTLANPGS